jgi:hypothetical protein
MPRGWGQVGGCDEKRHGKGTEEADGGEDGGELSHKARGVAVGGEKLEVDDAEKEDTVENAELEDEVVPISWD